MILHLRHRNRERCPAKRLDQARVLRIKAGKCSRDARIRLVRMLDYVLHLLRRQLRCLFRRDLPAARSHHSCERAPRDARGCGRGRSLDTHD